MYFISILMLLFVLPVVSVAVQSHLHPHVAGLIPQFGRWMVFWAVGIRLLLAGVRQVIQPRFTAEEIFGIFDPKSLPIVREVGFGNLSMAILAVLSLFHRGWVVPAAIVGGLYYGLAGLGHLPQKQKNAKENVAMLTDVWVFLVLLVFVVEQFV